MFITIYLYKEKSKIINYLCANYFAICATKLFLNINATERSLPDNLRFLNGGVLRNLNMYSFRKLCPGQVNNLGEGVNNGPYYSIIWTQILIISSYFQIQSRELQNNLESATYLILHTILIQIILGKGPTLSKIVNDVKD